MGKLLSLLARDDTTCCTPKSYDVFLDFENAAPTETEREVFDEVDRVLKESEAVLEEIQCYKVRRRRPQGHQQGCGPTMFLAATTIVRIEWGMDGVSFYLIAAQLRATHANGAGGKWFDKTGGQAGELILDTKSVCVITIRMFVVLFH